MSEIVYNVVARIPQGGDKSRWTQIGVLIKRDNGKLVIKFDTVPVNWDGWAEIVPVQKKKDEE